MNKGTLVIVDDDRSFVEAISIFLKDHGFQTIPTFNGCEGLTWLQSNRADLAIIDVHLPDISGIDVAERLRRAGKDIPLILISSDDCLEVQERCWGAGASLFLPKPLIPEELLDTICETLSCSS
ncbi:MAG: response regulator [Planctomycetota bacterium]